MHVMEERIYTIKDIAEQYKLAEETVRRYIRQGKLEAYMFGDTYRITETALLKFLEDRKNKTKK